jgi:hypothetical protein
MFGKGFSWKRTLGVSSAKGKISKAFGVPLTKSGQQKKAKKLLGGLLSVPKAPKARKAPRARNAPQPRKAKSERVQELLPEDEILEVLPGDELPEVIPIKEFVVPCPHCQQSARVMEDAVGKVVLCPHCQKPFTTQPRG